MLLDHSRDHGLCVCMNGVSFAKLFVLYKRYPLLLLANKTTAKSETHWTANILKKNIATPKRLKAMRQCKTKHTFFSVDTLCRTRKKHQQANDGRNEVT